MPLLTITHPLGFNRTNDRGVIGEAVEIRVKIVGNAMGTIWSIYKDGYPYLASQCFTIPEYGGQQGMEYVFRVESMTQQDAGAYTFSVQNGKNGKPLVSTYFLIGSSAGVDIKPYTGKRVLYGTKQTTLKLKHEGPITDWNWLFHAVVDSATDYYVFEEQPDLIQSNQYSLTPNNHLGTIIDVQVANFDSTGAMLDDDSAFLGVCAKKPTGWKIGTVIPKEVVSGQAVSATVVMPSNIPAGVFFVAVLFQDGGRDYHHWGVTYVGDTVRIDVPSDYLARGGNPCNKGSVVLIREDTMEAIEVGSFALVEKPTLGALSPSGSINVLKGGTVTLTSPMATGFEPIKYEWFASSDGLKSAKSIGRTQTVKWKPDSSCKVFCVANNKYGEDTSDTSLAITLLASPPGSIKKGGQK